MDTSLLSSLAALDRSDASYIQDGGGATGTTYGPVEPWVRLVSLRNVRIRHLQSLLNQLQQSHASQTSQQLQLLNTSLIDEDASLHQAEVQEITRLTEEITQLHALCVARDFTIVNLHHILRIQEEEASHRSVLEEECRVAWYETLITPFRMGVFVAQWESECATIRAECNHEMKSWRKNIKQFIESHVELLKSLMLDVRRLREQKVRSHKGGGS
eukprot:PhF_6_TR22427/c0_g1_i1/m.31826